MSVLVAPESGYEGRKSTSIVFYKALQTVGVYTGLYAMTVTALERRLVNPQFNGHAVSEHHLLWCP
jgi:hypothetical protein